MRIEHIAIFAMNLEDTKEFYTKYFGAKAGPIYENNKKGFKSYFLEFDEGCRVEVMQKSTVSGQKDEDIEIIGLSHFAISVGDKAEVDALTQRLRGAGYKILSEPRNTGDGYYESVISDPDGNRVEITI